MPLAKRVVKSVLGSKKISVGVKQEGAYVRDNWDLGLSDPAVRAHAIGQLTLPINTTACAWSHSLGSSGYDPKEALKLLDSLAPPPPLDCEAFFQVAQTSQAITAEAMRTLPPQWGRIALAIRQGSYQQVMEALSEFNRYLYQVKVDPTSSLVDLLTQSAERVLPRFFFLPTDPLQAAEDPPVGLVYPNCLGKALLLFAFCSVAGLRCLSIVPTSLSTDYYTAERQRLMKMVRTLIGKDAGLVRPQFLARLDEADRFFNDSIINTPRVFHAGLLVQLPDQDGSSGFRWLALDPNFGLSIPIYDHSLIEEAHAVLTFYRLSYPGLTVGLRSLGITQCFSIIRRIVRRLERAALELTELSSQRPGCVESERQVVAILRRPTVFEAILSSCPDQDPLSQSRELVPNYYPGLMPTVDALLLWEHWRLGLLSPGDERGAELGAREIYRLTAIALGAHALKLVERAWRLKRGALLRPQIELGNPEWIFTCAVLSHVSACKELSVADTMRTIASLCGGQFPLLNALLTAPAGADLEEQDKILVSHLRQVAALVPGKLPALRALVSGGRVRGKKKKTNG